MAHRFRALGCIARLRRCLCDLPCWPGGVRFRKPPGPRLERRAPGGAESYTRRRYGCRAAGGLVDTRSCLCFHRRRRWAGAAAECDRRRRDDILRLPSRRLYGRSGRGCRGRQCEEAVGKGRRSLCTTCRRRQRARRAVDATARGGSVRRRRRPGCGAVRVRSGVAGRWGRRLPSPQLQRAGNRRVEPRGPRGGSFRYDPGSQCRARAFRGAALRSQPCPGKPALCRGQGDDRGPGRCTHASSGRGPLQCFVVGGPCRPDLRRDGAVPRGGRGLRPSLEPLRRA